MCGIAVIFAYHYAALEVDRQELRKIRDAMSHRGPDGAGEWVSPDERVGLGHRRLAIIDLSERAAQPMVSQDGTLAVSFNGEIYNYKELRAGLEKEGRIFKSQSDTEVLLHLYEEKGEAMLSDLRGMFAIVLWDEKKKKMLLARDPYGIKPLYYADDGWTVRAASQVKALLTSQKVSRLSEPAGTVGFFLMGSIPEPFTLYQEIRQVPAGSYVWVNEIGPSAPKKYFSIASVLAKFRHPERSKGSSAKGGPAAFVGGRDSSDDEIHSALLDSLRHHFVSDVPVGLFLSSGIDSGALAGLAQEAGFKNLRTLTLAFDEFEGTEQDEAPLAEEVARLYGTRHSTVRLSKDEFNRELPKVFEAMDQPSIDGINTYFVSRAARQLGWKVALSGLGGDELFGGYPSFQEIPRIVRALAIPSRIPFLGEIFRHFIGRGVLQYAPTINPKYSGLLKYGGTYPGAYFLKRGLFMPWELGTVMNKETAREGLKRLDLFRRMNEEVANQKGPGSICKYKRGQAPFEAFARVAALESSFYLRNQLLRDADWAGMAHSLEIRTPFVDAWLLKKMAGVPAPSKKLLAGTLKNPLPEKVIHRPKTGFGIPIENWLDSKENDRFPRSRRWANKVMSHLRISASKEGLAVSGL